MNTNTVSPVVDLVQRARVAQQILNGYSQEQVDLLVQSVAWAILEPNRNRELAELAVRDTGLGNAEDKFKKNHRMFQQVNGLKRLKDLSEVRAQAKQYLELLSKGEI